MAVFCSDGGLASRLVMASSHSSKNQSILTGVIGIAVTDGSDALR